jgi:hypothetical protein
MITMSGRCKTNRGAEFPQRGFDCPPPSSILVSRRADLAQRHHESCKLPSLKLEECIINEGVKLVMTQILLSIDRSAERGEEGGRLLLVLKVLCARDEFNLSIGRRKTNNEGEPPISFILILVCHS